MRFILILSVLLVGCGKSSSSAPDSNVVAEATCNDGSEACAFVNAHNDVRKNASPAPSPALPKMSWNINLKNQAQSWADACTFGYDPARGLVGQNVFAYTALPTPQVAVDAWAAQSANYTYATNTCSAATCGNYTQLVWRSSNELGCAIKACSTGSPFSGSGPNWYVVVCNYTSPGNYVGQKPY